MKIKEGVSSPEERLLEFLPRTRRFTLGLKRLRSDFSSCAEAAANETLRCLSMEKRF